MKDLNPAEMVAVLDKTIIGQHEAKRAIAIAMRDRHRKMMLDDKDKHLVETRNILLKGPSGVAKTELARIIARECNFPFIKIDATSITSRGYVGGKMATHIKRFILEGEAMYGKVAKEYMDAAKNKIADMEITAKDVTNVCVHYISRIEKSQYDTRLFITGIIAFSESLKIGTVSTLEGTASVNYDYNGGKSRPLKLKIVFDIKNKDDLTNAYRSLCLLIWQLVDIKYGFNDYISDDAQYIEVLQSVVDLNKDKVGKCTTSCPVLGESKVKEKPVKKTGKKSAKGNDLLPDWGIITGSLREMRLKAKEPVGKKDTSLIKHTLKGKITEWFKTHNPKDQRFIVTLPDELSSARAYVENYGVIFIDEIDKLVNSGGHTHATTDVQFELLKLIEGGKYDTDSDNTFGSSSTGVLKTENILFICAGAFVNVNEDGLISELTGRLPVRITLHPLSEDNLYDILTKSDKSPLLSLQKLLAVDGIHLELTDGAIRAISRLAYRYNEKDINLGARRLQSILSMVTSEYSYEIGVLGEQGKVVIDEAAVMRTVKNFYENNNHIYELSDRELTLEKWAKFIKNNRSSPVHVERIKHIHKENLLDVDLQKARMLAAAVYATFHWANEPKPIIKRIFESLFEGEGELGDFPKYLLSILGQIVPRDITKSGFIHLTQENKTALDTLGVIVGEENVRAAIKSEWKVDKV